MPDRPGLLQYDEEGLFKLLCKSWLSRSRSTEAMMRGTVNEDACLGALKSMTFIEHIFSCGMLASSMIRILLAALTQLLSSY